MTDEKKAKVYALLDQLIGLMTGSTEAEGMEVYIYLQKSAIAAAEAKAKPASLV